MKNLSLSLRIAAVFIGTVVGAGLASGQEIIQFFTLYGFNGVIGIIICGILYIITGIITMELSYKYNAASYKDLIYLSCGKYLGGLVDALTTFFLFCGNCIILAGSGSVFYEAFGFPPIIGTIIMALLTAVVVFNSTEGLMFINSIIVPCMIIIVIVISALVLFTCSRESYGIWQNIVSAPSLRNNWFTSTLLYTAFNMLFATGVLCPMSRDIKKSPAVFTGVILGSIGLFLLTFTINIVLILNEPGVFKVSIPMLYIARNFGSFLIAALSVVIWMEMFSTEVSNVYSLAKKMQYNFKMNYKLSVILLLCAALPFTRLGFANLIKLLYPPFGVISMVYIICLVSLYYKSKKKCSN